MSLIDMEFKNLPDKTTPVNATNLNKLINGINFLDDKRMTVVTEANTDLNDYTETGVYYFSPDYTPTNIPIGVNGWLQVMNGTNAIKQIWHRHGTINTNDFNTYVRTKTTAGWSDWERLLTRNELYYKAGDTFTDKDFWTGGYITSTATKIEFDIYLPKKLDNVNSITLVSGSIIARGVGGYVEGSDGINLKGNGITTSVYKEIGNRISVRVVKSSALTGATNNTPVGIAVANISLKFN